MTSTKTGALQLRAEAHFKVKQQQKADAPIAMRDYRAREHDVRERTQRLRALRLARTAEAAMGCRVSADLRKENQ
jgi:hypothetical protein